jgi:hypothetical protein
MQVYREKYTQRTLQTGLTVHLAGVVVASSTPRAHVDREARGATTSGLWLRNLQYILWKVLYASFHDHFDNRVSYR